MIWVGLGFEQPGLWCGERVILLFLYLLRSLRLLITLFYENWSATFTRQAIISHFSDWCKSSFMLRWPSWVVLLSYSLCCYTVLAYMSCSMGWKSILSRHCDAKAFLCFWSGSFDAVPTALLSRLKMLLSFLSVVLASSIFDRFCVSVPCRATAGLLGNRSEFLYWDIFRVFGVNPSSILFLHFPCKREDNITMFFLFLISSRIVRTSFSQSWFVLFPSLPVFTTSVPSFPGLPFYHRYCTYLPENVLGRARKMRRRVWVWMKNQPI